MSCRSLSANSFMKLNCSSGRGAGAPFWARTSGETTIRLPSDSIMYLATSKALISFAWPQVRSEVRQISSRQFHADCECERPDSISLLLESSTGVRDSIVVSGLFLFAPFNSKACRLVDLNCSVQSVYKIWVKVSRGTCQLRMCSRITGRILWQHRKLITV